MAAISSGEMPNNRYIRKSPNGETQSATRIAVPSGTARTQGSETSQYLEEKKANLRFPK